MGFDTLAAYNGGSPSVHETVRAIFGYCGSMSVLSLPGSGLMWQESVFDI